MKKLLITAAVTGTALAALFGGSASALNDASMSVARGDRGELTKNGCTIKTSLPDRGTMMRDSRGKSDFSRLGDTALITMKATGDCEGQRVSLAAWYSTSEDGRPFQDQKLIDSKTRQIENGTSLMTIDIPGAEDKCFFQLDLAFGGPTENGKPNGGPEYGPDRLIQAVTGGKKDCYNKPPKPEEPKMIKVCNLKTREIIKIKASNFDKSKHTKDLNKCKDAPSPEKIKVCDLKTREIITINKKNFDKAKHSKDLNKCQDVPANPENPENPETPVTPSTTTVEVEPTATLTKTGPASVVAIFAAITVAAAAAHAMFARRRI